MDDFFMDDFHPRRLCYPMQISPSSPKEPWFPQANGPKFKRKRGPNSYGNYGSPKEMGLSSLWNDGSPAEMDPSS